MGLLDTQKVMIPSNRGMSQQVEPRAASVEVLQDCLNGVFERSGRIRKRNGYTAVTNTLSSGLPDTLFTQGRPKGLFSTGDELCCIGARSLFAYNKAHDKWYRSGPIGPAIGRQETILRSRGSFETPDMARNGSYVLYAAHQNIQGVSTSMSIAVTVYSEDRHTTVPMQLLADTDSRSVMPHAVRCISVGTKILLMFVEGTADPTPLKIYEWLNTTPNTAPVISAAPALSIFYEDDHVRAYDAMSMSDGNYCLATLDNASPRSITLRKRDSAHVGLATLVRAPPAGQNFLRVAISDSPSADRIYVLAGTDIGDLLLIGIRRTTWAEEFSVVVDPITSGWTRDRLAITEGSNGTSNTVAMVWCEYNGLELCRFKTRTTNTSGGGITTLYTTHNVFPTARPFWVKDRCYTPVSTRMRETPYEVAGMFDLLLGPTDAGVPTNVALFDVGTALFQSGSDKRTLVHGNCANAVSMTNANTTRFASTSTSFALEQATSDAFITRNSGDEIELRFDDAPRAAVSHRGTATIGGCFPAWYDGVRTFEIGHPTPPIIRAVAAYDDASGSLSGTVKHNATWEHFDNKGILHRSSPGVTISKNLVAPEDAVNFNNTKGSPLTIRPTKHSACVYYRADSAGNLKRITLPRNAIPNRVTDQYLVTDSDNGNQPIVDQGLLYTTGGAELESVSSEGARLPFVALNRLWLSSMHRKERMRFSKKLATGSSAEYALAPEFNELFTITMPSGHRVTGISSIDEKLIVFSEVEIFAMAGEGPDVAGGNNDFSGLVSISKDAGCIDPRSVVSYQDGVLFQSKIGLMRLDRSLQLSFVGQHVRTLVDDNPNITSSTVVPAKQEIRFTATNSDVTAGVTLVYNYLVDAWSYWEITDTGTSKIPMVGATMHDGDYYTISSTGKVYKESTAFVDPGSGIGSWITLRIETSHIQLAAHGSWQRIRKIAPLLERKGAFKLIINAFPDFGSTASSTWTFTDAVMSGWADVRLRQPVLRPTSRGKCQAMKIRIEDDIDSGSTGDSFMFAGIMVEAQVKSGVVKTGDTQVQ